VRLEAGDRVPADGTLSGTLLVRGKAYLKVTCQKY
jgi:hypothetical protein